MYAYQWTPDITGNTQLSQHSQTQKATDHHTQKPRSQSDSAAATPAPTDAPVHSMADLYFVQAIVGLLFAIIVVGLLIIFALRKRP